MQPQGSSRWYVIQTKPREETRALQNLERQGFECFMPTMGIEKLRHGCRRVIREPLFPGYLFIHLDKIHDNWHSIRSTRGVLQIVRFHEYPIPVSENIIEGIRERILAEPIKVPYLKPGEAVRITEGPFCDLEAIFLANDGQERVVLLMHILHHEQTLSFPATAVRKKA